MQNRTAPIALKEKSADFFDQIFDKDYAQQQRQNGIARPIHGIQHAVRVALYIPVFANLCRRYDHEEALKLTDEDLYYLQVAALLHDSARENDGEDFWDQESAIKTHQELINLGASHEKAKRIAEAVANKDTPSGEFSFAIVVDEKGNIICQEKNQPYQRGIAEDLLQASDALDIIRARPHFEGDRLHFYTGVIQPIEKTHPEALLEFATVITEARSLIAEQGDTFQSLDYNRKKEYECREAYEKTLNLIKQKPESILHQFCHGLVSAEKLSNPLVDTTPFDPTKPLTQKNLEAGLRDGLIFARGIGNPTAVGKKQKSKINKENPEENGIEKEYRKMSREENKPTLTGKMNKSGNQNRSLSLIGFGSPTFCPVGFLSWENTLKITHVSAVISHSGYGSKKNAEHQNVVDANEILNLRKRLMLGGKSTVCRRDFATGTNEVMATISNVFAVFYSNDHTLYNIENLGQRTPMHQYASILQALYVRQAYQKVMRNEIALPIIEYSATENKIRLVPDSEISDDKIIDMWTQMCSDYLRKNIEHEPLLALETLENLKTKSMFKFLLVNNVHTLGLRNMPADMLYPPELQNKINEALELKKQQILLDHETQLIADIEKDPNMLLSDAIFTYLQNNKAFIEQHKQLFKSALESVLQTNTNLFTYQNNRHNRLDLKSFQLPIQKLHFLATHCQAQAALTTIQTLANKQWLDEKEQLIKDLQQSHQAMQSSLRALQTNKTPETLKELVDRIEEMVDFYLSADNNYQLYDLAEDVKADCKTFYQYCNAIQQNIELLRATATVLNFSNINHAVQELLLLDNCRNLNTQRYALYFADAFDIYLKKRNTRLKIAPYSNASSLTHTIEKLAKQYLLALELDVNSPASTNEDLKSRVSMIEDVLNFLSAYGLNENSFFIQSVGRLICSIITLDINSKQIAAFLEQLIFQNTQDTEFTTKINDAVCTKLKMMINNPDKTVLDKDIVSQLVKIHEVLPANNDRAAFIQQINVKSPSESSQRFFATLPMPSKDEDMPPAYACVIS